MYLQSISSSFPDYYFSQREVLQIWQDSKTHFEEKFGLSQDSFDLAKKILGGDSGIEKRYFAIDAPETLLSYSAGELNALFERETTKMSIASLEKALAGCSITANEIDAVFLCTCTGYICPGVTSHVAEKLEMRSNVYLNDMVGLGCGAAIPMLRAAEGFLSANPEATVATIAVESCSSAFFICNDSGVIISLCLFGDGSSASIWKNTPGKLEYRTRNFQTLHLPEQREKIRFVNDNGKLRNKLHMSVPSLAGKAVKQLYQSRTVDHPHVLTHTGGKSVLDSIEKKCQFEPLSETREILRRYGNTSSPSVMLALEEYLRKSSCKDEIWLSSFGAGFACHSFELTRNQ